MPDDINLRQRLSDAPARILNRLPLAGKLMIVAQRDGVTHERIGIVERLEKQGDRVVCIGEAHDCSIDLASVTSVVIDRTARMKDKVLPKLEFQNASEETLFTVVSLDNGDKFDLGFATLPGVPIAVPDKKSSEPSTLANDDPGLSAVEGRDRSGDRDRNPDAAPRPRPALARDRSRHQSGDGIHQPDRRGFPSAFARRNGCELAEASEAAADGAVELAAIGQDGNPLGLVLVGPAGSVRDRLMLPTQDPAVFEHPRATWIDPSSGRELDERSLMHEMATRQVVLLGETHTIAEIHRWQLHVATVLRFIRPDIAVGFEMFPRRVQPVLDEWVAGELSSQAFLEKVDWDNNWGYDAQLYFPLFHFCRQQRVPMLALNCNRPLVTRVGKEGWDAIPEDERDGLSPSAEATMAYREYLYRPRSQPVADRARIGDGSKARSVYPRPADLGSRLCLQHCAGARSSPIHRW